MKTLSTFTYHKKQQAKNQQRLLKIVCFMLVWSLVISISVFHGSVAVGESRIPQTVVVEEGESLWTIAGKHLPDGENIRDYIEKIRRQNGLESAVIYPGQSIELP